MVKVMEKYSKELSMEGGEEGAIIKFIFQKCHSGYSVGNTLIGGQRKRENIIFCLSVNKIC